MLKFVDTSQTIMQDLLARPIERIPLSSHSPLMSASAPRIADELRARRAELSMMKSAEATSLVTEIEDALASPLPSKGQELVERADLLVEEEFKAMAAEERRRAVLEGLAGLGYEVFEGMATAWVQNGQIVIRKAANPGYGVELLGGPRSDLLQVRAVGIGSSAEARDASRDHDMETIRCGEFDRLKALVAEAGGNVTMEFARPVGRFPLKIVSDPGASQEAEIVERSRRARPISPPH
ncbi:hypothetical protein [Bradyrhizobium japonicum]|uniref:hypothetical protein n=1 Tax=Bradyrhizobium japonicum TaxID=375 RepID=UPI002715174B|nr:hypothetical protein [Bradyrhizobium japonicum]WLB52779.1 hypothetical protein QIH94_36525 [Bradyrhizobium japonicum]WLB65368.1 hypothetical protein QIH96_09355 [Bradyrhizobium japonicum]